jgi:outer membrane protein assembly factor BamB
METAPWFPDPDTGQKTPANDGSPRVRLKVKPTDLVPSPDYWDKVEPPQRQVLPLGKDRRLVVVGDSLFAIDREDYLLWSWTLNGPPIIDKPVLLPDGTLVVIACDMIFAGLDAANGSVKWEQGANGSANYLQIGIFRDDVYFIVTGYEFYRLNGSPSLDHVGLYHDRECFWSTSIPADSVVDVSHGRMFVTYFKNGKKHRRQLAVTLDEGFQRR